MKISSQHAPITAPIRAVLSRSSGELEGLQVELLAAPNGNGKDVRWASGFVRGETRSTKNACSDQTAGQHPRARASHQHDEQGREPLEDGGEEDRSKLWDQRHNVASEKHAALKTIQGEAHAEGGNEPTRD